MRQCIRNYESLACFNAFFFDTWCRGIKTEFNVIIQDTITDINWDIIDLRNSFIDYAIEVIPASDTPLIGLPVGDVSGAVASDGPRGNLVRQFLLSQTSSSRPVYRYVYNFQYNNYLTQLVL